MQIDATTYRKDTRHPQRWGYQLRGNAPPSSIVIHTTNNTRATQFATEATFLRDSANVSAHYLISKTGQIVQFLDPARWQAWHAGNALPLYLNARSIGIEHHVSIGESWTAAQHVATTWLVRSLVRAFHIPISCVDTHRAVALPKGRKSDPAGWDNAAFYMWRDTQLGTPVPTMPAPTLPATITPASLLLWEPRATPAQCAAYILARPHGAYTAFDVRAIVAAYFAQATGVDPLLAIAQMIHETGNLCAALAQRPIRNPAGIGVDGSSSKTGGVGYVWDSDYGTYRKALTFASWDSHAVPAHIGRLLAYATATPTPAQQALITDALALRPLPIAYRGAARELAGLNGRWAPSAHYVDKIAAIANAIRGTRG